MSRWYYVPVVLLIAAVTALVLSPTASAQPAPQPLVGQIVYVGSNVVAVRTLPPDWVTRVTVSTNNDTRVFVDGYPANLGDLKVGMMAEITPGVGMAQEIRATSAQQ